MRSSNSIFVVAALAGLAVASPAPQGLDFNQVTAASTVAAGPSNNGVPQQTASIPTTVTVSTTATASVTGAATSAAAQKRSLEERTICIPNALLCSWFGTFCCPSSSPSSTTSCTTSTTSSSVKSTTSSSTSTTSSSTSTTSSSSSASTLTCATTSYTPYYPALATVTEYTTGTTTISSTSSCPTTPEQGTYCGFINPEDPCAPQPDGYGPVPTPDTVSAFYAYAPFHSMASAAPSTIPAAVATPVAGQITVYNKTFNDLNASSSAQSYISLTTLQSYNVTQCAALCDCNSLCTAFNIYVERDPSVNPCNNDSTAPTVWGYNCPNPASMTSYKCTLWGSNLDASTATNAGQWREEFQVVITASDGYDKTNVTVPTTPTGTSCNGAGWNPATSCNGKAISAAQYWMGSKFFPGPYNPQLCGDYAIAQNFQNKNAAVAKGLHSYTPCNMFNAYYLHKNNQPYGTYCALYDTDVSVSKATYTGGNSGSDNYSCRQSYKYTLSTVDSGKC